MASATSELYKKWQQENQSAQPNDDKPSGSATSQLYQQWRRFDFEKNREAYEADIQSRMQALQGKESDFFSSYNARVKNSNPNSYVADSGDWYDSVSQAFDEYDTEAVNLMLDLKKYADFYDKDYIDSMISSVQNSLRNYRSVKDYAEAERNYYAQWENEEEFKSYIAQVQEQENKKNLDVDEAQREIDALKEELNALKVTNVVPQNNYLTGNSSDTSIPYATGQQAQMKATPTEARITELEKMISQKEAYMNSAKRLQDGVALAGAVTNDDFDDFSGYVSTKSDDFVVGLTNQYSLGYEDLTYEYINNQNGLRDEIKNKHKLYTGDGTESYYESQGYDYLTEDEISIYNYYYAKEGKEKAEEYLNSIQETLNYRKATQMYEPMENQTLLELAFGVGAGLDQFTSGIRGLLNFKDDYIPVSATQIASGMVREDLKDAGPTLPEWMGGGSLGQMGYDAITTSANMAPSILASVAIGMLNHAAGQVVGSTLMGGAAAGNAYQEALNEGYSKDQARSYGMLVGASEIAMEKVLGGISALGGNSPLGKLITGNVANADTALKMIAKKIGGSMISEFSEEYLQEVLTPVFENMILRTDNKVKLFSAEALYSGILGALTAGIMEGPGAITGEVNTYNTGLDLQAKGITAQNLAEIGSKFSADTVAYQIASKVDENTGAYTIGRLFNEIGATMTEQNVADITNALVEEGMTEDIAKKNAQVIAYIVDGGEVSDLQMRMIQKNEALAKVMKEVIIDPNSALNQRMKGYTEVVALSTQEYSRLVEAAQQPQEAAEATEEQVVTQAPKVEQEVQADTTQAPMATVQENRTVSKEESVPANDQQVTGKLTGKESLQVAEDGVTRQESTGKTVMPQKIVSISNGKAVIQTDNGKISAEDIVFGDKDTDMLWRSAIDFHGINPAGANGIIRAYRSGDSVTTYLSGAAQEFRNGYYNLPSGGQYADKLTSAQREIIYELGQKAAGENTAKAQAKATKAKKVAVSQKETTTSRNGKVHFARKGRTFDAVRETALETMEQLSAVLGVEFHVYESYKNADGKRVYKDSDGNEVSAPNGYIDPKDGSIHIDLNAGTGGKGTMLFTIAHELTHFIKQWSPAKFKVLANFLINQYSKQNVSVNELVDAQIAKAEKSGRELSWDEAFEEMVADSMEAMLTDGNVVQMMADLKQQDKTLWQKICGWFRDLAENLKAVVDAYKGYRPDSQEGRMVADMRDVIVMLESFYADALADASDNYQATGVQKNTTREGSVKYSIERTKNMSWDEQIKGALYDGKNIRRNDTLIVADPADTAVANVIKDVPLAIPLSILTKASTGKDVSHSIKRGKLANLDEGIKNATMTIVNPERNAVVFVTNITQGGLPVIAAFDMNATFDGDKVHKATSIHLQVDTQAMLQNLPESATVYVQKNELDPVGATNNLRGLAAKIKFIKNVAQHAKNVKKKFSLRDTGEDLDTKEEQTVDSVDERIPITMDMTEVERYEALKDRSISVTAKTNMDALRSIEEKIGQETETAILLRETDRKKLFVKIAEEFDVFKEYSNADVKLTFNFSKGNLKESVGKQRKNYSDFAKMLSCLNEIIETAIGIEVHNRNSDGYKPDPTLKSVYVLVSAFEDGNNIIPVKLEIKEFADKDNTLYVAIALESIKKDEVVKQGNTENGVTQYSRSSIIKIADLFSKINPTDESFLKYVPKQFLTKSNDAVQNQQSADNKTFTAQSDNQFSDRDPELEKVNRMLEKQNEKLKDDVAYLKELLKLQKQVTGGAKFTKTSVEAAAGQLMKYADAKGNKNELAKLLNSLYEYIAKGEELTWEGVKEAAAPAVEWLQGHENTKKQIADYAYDEELIAQDLLRQVYDSYWNVSTLYTVADKMQKEINKLKYEHSSRMSTLRKAHREQTAQLKQEHREAIQSVRQAERERSEKKLQDISKRYQESRERGVENRRKTEMRRKIRRTIMELDKLLNRGDKKKNVKEDMKDFVAQALKSADILFTDEYSREDMILNGIGTGLKGQEAKYIAEAREIMEQMGNLPSGSYEAFQQRQEAEARLKGKLAYRMSKLQDVFTRERARLNAAEVSDVLGNLADAYASLEDSEHSYVNGAFHENVYQYLLMLKKDVGGTTVKDMNLNQLEELHKAYTMVLTTVRNANKMFAANMKQTREQLGNQTIAEVRKAGGEKELWLPGEDKINAFFWNNEKPVYAFERIGSSTLARLFENIRAGEDTWAKDMDHARKYYLEQSQKYKYDSWDFNKQYNFTSSSGIDFSLNLEQIMSLYAYSKREQAHDHLMKGGFVFDGNTEVRVSKMGVPVTYLKKTAKAHNVSPEILGDIISKLTSAQKAFVDEMQDYLSTTMGAKGNEVSIQLYGVELFKEKYYFPLRSAGQYKEKAKETDQRREQGQISIVNSGFTKSTTPKSSNSVVLSGFMDVWAEHVNEMSMYHSFVLPMEDFRRVYNYKTTPSENQESVSVNSTIQNAYGEAATKYIDQLYQDLNGGAISDPRENMGKALMGRFKKAAVFASLSVVIQQPSAIGRAFAIIDPKYFVGTKVDNKRHKALWAELKMYAPVASIKEMGYFDTGMGKSAQDFIKGKEYGSLKEKAAALFTDSNYRDELLSKAPALADELTWCAIWDAVKRETKAKNSGMNVKSEEFLQLAGKRFTEVITKTQVYDSVLSRSANMRSKGNFMSMWTAFMAEPTTTINMVEDALRKGKQGDRKYAARTMGAVLCSVILNSALASLVYAMRDDDEDETFLEKYVQSFAVEILDGINPLTYYPFLKDVWSILHGFDIERADMSLITSLTEALTKLVQIYSKDTDGMDEEQLAAHTKNLANAWWGVVDYVTALVGIPVKNVRRDINGAINTVKTIAADLTDRDTSWGSLLDKTWDNVKNSIPVVGWLPDETAADKLYKATVNGDTAYQKRLSSSYSTESALNSAIRKGLRNNDSRIWEAAIAWNNNDLETYKQIAMSIVAEGNFSQDNVVMAIRAEAEALAPDVVENTSASNAKSYFTAEKFAVAIAQSNDAMAAVIKEDIIETAIKNGKTADEAEQSFKSSAKSKLKELFLAGEISEEQAVSALTNYLGLEMEDAESDVGEWTFKAEYPELDGIVSYTQFANWQIYGQSSGVAMETLTDVAGFRKDGTSGNVKSQDEVATYIDSLPISSSQKDALWCCFWKESTLNNAPWHQTE